MSIENVTALVFDTFGTVVDWRRSIIRQLSDLGARKGMQADWEAFADAWRAGYHPAMDRIRRGERAFATIDVLHRERLDELLDDFNIGGLNEDEKQELNRAWHRLDPWPDSVVGLQQADRGGPSDGEGGEWEVPVTRNAKITGGGGAPPLRDHLWQGSPVTRNAEIDQRLMTPPPPA